MGCDLSHVYIAYQRTLYIHFYVFRDSKGANIESFIVKNAVKVSAAHVHAGYPHGDSSVSVVLELDPLDRVYCRLSNGIIYSASKSGAGMVHFAGFLIASFN